MKINRIAKDLSCSKDLFKNGKGLDEILYPKQDNFKIKRKKSRRAKTRLSNFDENTDRENSKLSTTARCIFLLIFIMNSTKRNYNSNKRRE